MQKFLITMTRKRSLLKQLSIILIFPVVLFFSCEESGENATEAKNTGKMSGNSKDLINKMYDYYGYENLDNIESINFTFNAFINGTLKARTWKWEPGENNVYWYDGSDWTVYNRNAIDSPQDSVLDQKFINDSYWLIFPWYLSKGAPDLNTDLSKNETSPVYGEKLNMLTASYGDGGYTPGDTYRAYVTNEGEIKEWAYIPSGSKEPAMSTDFSQTKEFNGIKFPTYHYNKDSTVSIYFTDIVVVEKGTY
jgi:hypothetical protein